MWVGFCGDVHQRVQLGAVARQHSFEGGRRQFVGGRIAGDGGGNLLGAEIPCAEYEE